MVLKWALSLVGKLASWTEQSTELGLALLKVLGLVESKDSMTVQLTELGLVETKVSMSV
jgi:hypothetical protein